MAGTVTQTATDIIIFSGAPTNYERNLRVRKFMWCGNTGASDDIKFHDYDSTTILETIAGASGCNLTLDFSDCPKHFNGIKVSALDAGKLFVYLA